MRPDSLCSQTDRLKKQRGQIILENVLLMIVLVGLFAAIIDFLKRQEFATKFTEAPWAMMNGMIQCGDWTPCGVEKPAADVHPNSQTRVLSLDPRVGAL